MYKNIFDTKIKEDTSEEILIENINLNDVKELIKIIEITKAKKKIIFNNNKQRIIFEKNRLYDALVVQDKMGKIYYKKIINIKPNNDSNMQFDNYYLSVGTVVELMDEKKYLIISRVLETSEGIADYVGCDYNIGYGEDVQIFSHSEIKKILSLPYEDEEVLLNTLKIKKWMEDRNDSK